MFDEENSKQPKSRGTIVERIIAGPNRHLPESSSSPPQNGPSESELKVLRLQYLQPSSTAFKDIYIGYECISEMLLGLHKDVLEPILAELKDHFKYIVKFVCDELMHGLMKPKTVARLPEYIFDREK